MVQLCGIDKEDHQTGNGEMDLSHNPSAFFGGVGAFRPRPAAKW